MMFAFFNLGFGEIFAIFVVVLLLFGADKIPEFARSLGKGIRYVKDATDGVKKDIQSSVDEVREDIDVNIKQVKEGVDVANSVKRKSQSSLKEVLDDIANTADVEAEVSKPPHADMNPTKET